LTAPAFDELLRALSEAEVEFVLIGGLALGARGVVRGTKDVDVVVAPGEVDAYAMPSESEFGGF
jgi:hypothetical protein